MENTENEIFSEQVRLLHVNSTLPIIVSVAAAGLLSYSLLPVTQPQILVSWFLLFFVVSMVRLYFIFLFKKSDRKPEYWHRLFLVSTCAAAAIWGSSSFIMFPEQNLSQQIVFFMIMLGMAAGAVSSLCPSLPIVIGFLSLQLIPFIFKMMLMGTGESWFNASLILLFWAVVMIGAIRINGSIRENIELHIQSKIREMILKVSEERYRHIFNNAPLGIFHYDIDGVIIDCNEPFVRLLNSSREVLIGLNMPAQLKDQEMLDAINASLRGGEGYYEGDYTSVTSKTKTTTSVRTFFKAIKQPEGTIIGGVGIVEDYSERKKSAEIIQYQASYDHLTGLSNRRLLMDSLTEEISRAQRHGHYGALLFFDLDNFKTINDSLGHAMGDKLLKVISKRIKENLRKEDTAARMGGDEFVVIATELGTTHGLAAYKAKAIAEKITALLSGPCQIDGHNLHVTASVGISVFPAPDKGVDDILMQADSAMYRAKAARCNVIKFFLPHMQDAADERLRLNMEIREALANDQFELFYQPQVDNSGTIVGAEALLRWNHPQRGLVMPGTFLEIAEETGIMQDIGHWVLREACQQIKAWTDAGVLSGSHMVSINISGKEIVTPGFVEKVRGVLRETEADPHHLGIELTESSLVPSGKDIVQKIIVLQKMGIRFSVDDFGTGYSSLNYLKTLPLNTLKIDRSFVNDIQDGNENVVLVDTIISLAKNLGLGVIAEGVETKQELKYLEARGCTVFQGFYFSKPVPAAVFTDLFTKN